MIQEADSLEELTPEGEKVLQEMNTIMRNTENRWGELTGFGKRQLQNIGQRMAERFPEVLCPGATVSGISTTGCVPDADAAGMSPAEGHHDVIAS